jgi:hypothetical protein
MNEEAEPAVAEQFDGGGIVGAAGRLLGGGGDREGEENGDTACHIRIRMIARKERSRRSGRRWFC